jgi:hypothetical protein
MTTIRGSTAILSGVFARRAIATNARLAVCGSVEVKESMATNIKPLILDETECQAILNEAAEQYCRLGTTGNFLHVLVSLAYSRGLDHEAAAVPNNGAPY